MHGTIWINLENTLHEKKQDITGHISCDCIYVRGSE